MACLQAAAWVVWVAWAEWTTEPSAYSLTKAINNSRVPKGARLFCCTDRLIRLSASPPRAIIWSRSFAAAEMAEIHKVRVSKKRDFRPFAEHFHAARMFYAVAEHEERGSALQTQACLIFCAFCVEAYLNHVGPKFLNFWDEVEPLRVMAKLRLLLKQFQNGARFWGMAAADEFQCSSDIETGWHIHAQRQSSRPLSTTTLSKTHSSMRSLHIIGSRSLRWRMRQSAWMP